MEQSLLAKHLRTLLRTSNALLEREGIAFADVAALQRDLQSLQAQPLAGPGVDLNIESSVRRLRLALTAKDFEVSAAGAGGFSLGRWFARPPNPEQAALQQQKRVRKALGAFRDEINHALFAMVV